MRGFLRGRVAGPAHNPPPFASWAWDQAMAELGRNISENIRLILDIMEFTKVKKLPGLLLS